MRLGCVERAEREGKVASEVGGGGRGARSEEEEGGEQMEVYSG